MILEIVLKYVKYKILIKITEVYSTEMCTVVNGLSGLLHRYNFHGLMLCGNGTFKLIPYNYRI